MRDDSAFDFERRVGCVVGSTGVWFALLVAALRNMCRAETGDRLHRPEHIVEDISPMAQHVNDDAALILLAVIPGRPLRWHHIPLEDPVTKLAADGEDAAKKSQIAERF